MRFFKTLRALFTSINNMIERTCAKARPVGLLDHLTAVTFPFRQPGWTTRLRLALALGGYTPTHYSGFRMDGTGTQRGLFPTEVQLDDIWTD